jgi:hypothetical protein
MGQATQSGALITARRRMRGMKVRSTRTTAYFRTAAPQAVAEVMAARAWHDRNFSGGPDPRIRKAGVTQGPLQQRNQRPLLVLAVGEVVTVRRSTQVPVTFAQLAASD